MIGSGRILGSYNYIFILKLEYITPHDQRKGEMGKVLWKLRQEGFLASCYNIKGKVTLVGYFHKEKATSV